MVAPPCPPFATETTVNPPVEFVEYWYFHVPNYVLAALMYSLVGRFLLSIVFAPDSANYIYRAFVRLTDPALAAIRFVTPHAVPALTVVIFAALWVLILRFALLATFTALGIAPTIEG